MVDRQAALDYRPTQRMVCSPRDSVHRPCGRLRWFVVGTHPKQQAVAEAALLADGWPAYHPLHLHRVAGHAPRIVSLFPGYLFVQFDPASSDWPRVCRVRAVTSLLGAPGHPSPVPSGVVEQLLSRTSARRVVDDPLSDGAHVYLRPGARVEVLEGPLRGLEGICQASAQDRCAVLLRLLGREMIVELPPAQVVSVR